MRSWNHTKKQEKNPSKLKKTKNKKTGPRSYSYKLRLKIRSIAPNPILPQGQGPLFSETCKNSATYSHSPTTREWPCLWVKTWIDQLISLNSIEREKNYYSLTDNSGQYTDSPRPESWKYHIRPMSLEGTVSLLQFQSPLDARTGNDGKGEDQND